MIIGDLFFQQVYAVFTAGNTVATVQFSLSPNALPGAVLYGTKPATYKVSSELMEEILIFSLVLAGITLAIIGVMIYFCHKNHAEK